MGASVGSGIAHACAEFDLQRTSGRRYPPLPEADATSLCTASSAVLAGRAAACAWSAVDRAVAAAALSAVASSPHAELAGRCSAAGGML